MGGIAGGIDGIEAVFDDGSLVADAGLLLAGAVMDRLGLEALIDEAVRPPESGRGSGAEALSVVASMLVGGSFIGDAHRLRSGSASGVLPFAVSAPSALGTWLRSFAFGHVRRLDRAHELALARAWSVGAAPEAAELTVDLDSTVCEVFGKAKQGAAYGHTKVLGCHPPAAVRDDTGEVVHTRMRSGSSQRGHVRFAAETLARLRRLAPDAAVTVRADSGFFSYDMIDKLNAHCARWSVTVPQNAKVKAAIDGIGDTAWAPIAHAAAAEAQVAETTIDTGRRDRSGPRKLRLVARRTRLPEGPQRELWPDWRHHCLITNRSDLDAEAADSCHRAHARVELAIRDLKDNGLAHCPSGNFSANGAWLACAALAHNLASAPRQPRTWRIPWSATPRACVSCWWDWEMWRCSASTTRMERRCGCTSGGGRRGRAVSAVADCCGPTVGGRSSWWACRRSAGPLGWCSRRRWRCARPGCEAVTVTEQDPEIAPPREKLTSRAGRWATRQAGLARTDLSRRGAGTG